MARLVFASLALVAVVSGQSIEKTTVDGRPTCTVYPGSSNATDDVPTIVEAFEECGTKGNIIFPSNNTYHINSRLNPVLNDVTIDWQGEWLVCGPSAGIRKI